MLQSRVDVSSHASFGLEGKYACLKKFYAPHMENFLSVPFSSTQVLDVLCGNPYRLFWDKLK
jgi:hypothetical protein